MGPHYATCSWTPSSGYLARTPYGEIKMYGDGGHRAVEVMMLAAASCLDAVLVAYVTERNLSVTGIHVTCDAEISQNPIRVSAIKTLVKVEGGLSNKEIHKMVTMCERACKVMNTFKNRPRVEVAIEPLTTE